MLEHLYTLRKTSVSVARELFDRSFSFCSVFFQFSPPLVFISSSVFASFAVSSHFSSLSEEDRLLKGV